MSDLRDGARIPVYIISQNDAPERLVAIWADAERLGFPIIRVATAANSDDDGSYMDGQRRAWQRIAQGDAPFAAVLEDNVVLDERLMPLLDRSFLSKALPPRSVLVLDAKDRHEAERPAAAIVRPNVLPAECHAYIVSRVAVRHLMELGEGETSFADVLAKRRQHGIDTLAVLPPPVTTASDTPEPDAGGPARSSLVSRLRDAVQRISSNNSAPFEPVPVPAPEPKVKAAAT